MKGKPLALPIWSPFQANKPAAVTRFGAFFSRVLPPWLDGHSLGVTRRKGKVSVSYGGWVFWATEDKSWLGWEGTHLSISPRTPNWTLNLLWHEIFLSAGGFHSLPEVHLWSSWLEKLSKWFQPTSSQEPVKCIYTAFCHDRCYCQWSCSVVSDSLRYHGL